MPEVDVGSLPLFEPGDLDGYGPVERAALRALVTLPWQPGSARYAIMVCTARLARALDQAPTASLAAELRRNMSWLVGSLEVAEDQLDQHRAAVSKKLADALIKHAFSALPEASGGHDG